MNHHRLVGGASTDYRRYECLQSLAHSQPDKSLRNSDCKNYKSSNPRLILNETTARPHTDGISRPTHGPIVSAATILTNTSTGRCMSKFYQECYFLTNLRLTIYYSRRAHLVQLHPATQYTAQLFMEGISTSGGAKIGRMLQMKALSSSRLSISSDSSKGLRRVRDDIPVRLWAVASISLWEKAAFWGL